MMKRNIVTVHIIIFTQTTELDSFTELVLIIFQNICRNEYIKS